MSNNTKSFNLTPEQEERMKDLLPHMKDGTTLITDSPYFSLVSPFRVVSVSEDIVRLL